MKSPSVVILGVSGMLGHKLFQHLRTEFPFTTGVMRQSAERKPLEKVSLLHGSDIRTGIDAIDFSSLRSLLEELRPDVVINAIGIVKQRDAALSPIQSITINSLLPHQLSETVARWNGRLIHFSTDCVFSGRRGRYSESDIPDAEDLYGRSKYLGEVAGPNAITLRTSIIGRELAEHRSLLDWLLSQRGGRVRGFRKVVYSGLTTNEMAKVVGRLISDHRHLSGLFQVVSEPITKFELLRLIREAYGLQIEIEPDDAEVSDRSMRGDKFRDATGYVAPSWRELVCALASDETPYAEWGTSVL